MVAHQAPPSWDSPGKNTGVGCHFLLQCMKVKSESEVAQSCPTLSDPMDCSLSGSSIHGIFQARVLEWGAIAFSGPQGLYQFNSVQSLSHVRLFAAPRIAARQVSLSITNSQSLPKLMSIKSVMPSSHLILCRPLLLLPQSLPASESFPMSQFFAQGGQSIGVSASASVLPKNTQD